MYKKFKYYAAAIITICALLCAKQAQAVVYTIGDAQSVEEKWVDKINYSIGLSQSRLDYDWYGASEATFSYDLTVIHFGVAYPLDEMNSIEARYGYGFGMGSDTTTDLMGTEYTIKFSKYHEFELLYRHKTSDDWDVYAGVGIYLQEVPITWKNGYKYDEDNDNGYFVGAEYHINKHFSIDIFAKQTSKIGKGRGHSTEVALGSTIRQVGMGIVYIF